MMEIPLVCIDVQRADRHRVPTKTEQATCGWCLARARVTMRIIVAPTSGRRFATVPHTTWSISSSARASCSRTC
jgi:hypothetical protein